MSRTTTSCPLCYDGKTYQPCEACEGTGTTNLDAKALRIRDACPDCGGGGELEVHGCELCGGAGQVRFGLMRISERGRCLSDTPPVHPLVDDPEVAARPDPLPGHHHPVFLFEQDAHGSTNGALAAWASMRHHFRAAKLLRIRATAILVPDGQGGRTVVQTAAVVESHDTALYLTGVSWGYGGEGPNGLAAILDDLEFFPDYDEALRWAASQTWQPAPPGGPTGPSAWTLAGVGPAA